MPYTLTHTDNSPLITVADAAINTTTDLVFIGKNYPSYGQFLNQNFVKLLENFAHTSAPPKPLIGQLWWDTTHNILKIWSGLSWRISSGATSATFASPPTDLSGLGGDLWFDSTNGQLKVYTGSNWITVGPAATLAVGDSGAIPTVISDTTGSSNIVIQFRISGTIYAIYSTKTFNSNLTGFSTIKPGLNFSSAYSQGLNTQDTAATASTIVQRDTSGGINATAASITGTATIGSVVASTLSGVLTGNVTGNITATRVTASTITTAGITATSGYTGTILTAAQPNITSLGNIANLQLNGSPTLNGFALATYGQSIDGTPVGSNTPSTGKFTFVTLVNGLLPVSNLGTNLGSTTQYFGNTFTGGLTANIVVSTAANITTLTSPVASITSAQITGLQARAIGNITAGSGAFTTITATTNISPTSNLTVNLGSASAWFNNIYGTAIHARYADLAERFESDQPLLPGTVVELGGPAEIMEVGQDLSENVFGVISTSAAYLMNSSAGTNQTHPPVAVQGRVPVRVIGIIRNGDRLVSAGNGLARAGARNEITAWNVIGRALEDKLSVDLGIIEAVVKLNS